MSSRRNGSVYIRWTRSRLLPLLGVLAGLIGFSPISMARTASADPPFLDGVAAGCDDFQLYLGLFSVDIPDPGWTWVDPSNIFHDATGVALKSEITHTDFPVVHDSHDINVDILLDPGQEHLLSIVNPDKAAPAGPDTIEVEWEIGTFPNELGPNSPERYLPKWAWPNQGDRVWVNGHHIYDCGHTTDVDGIARARSEIHPPRAIASMRDQVGTLPGTGTTPVPLTAVDLYIHGNAGFVTEILYCGQELIIGDAATQDASGPFDCAIDTTPIDDNFEFDVPLPPRPTSTAVLATSVENGPGNNVDIAPIVTPVPAGNPTSLHVTIPLEGTGVADLATYARQIKAGWVYPPTGLRHFGLTLNKMDLHEDQDLDPGDCECTFFWMNVDKAPREWIRLADFATGNMNDYDDDGGFGDGEMGFSGATFDYYVADGDPVSVRAHGYDQDCLDDYFGDHRFRVTIFLDCYLLAAFELEAGDNDDYNVLSASHGAPDYGVGNQDVSAGGQYELEYTISEVPIELEDQADLSLRKVCKPDNTALAGQTVTCTILVDNPGPGLPRDVVVTDTLLTNVDPSNYTIGPATFVFEFQGSTSTPSPCTATPPNQFTCALGTVPVGGRAVITVSFSSLEGGDFNNEAIVRSSSSDPNLGNNQDIDGLTVVPVSDLQLAKSDAPDPVIAGETITWSLTATNNGPSTATNVVVHDDLPAGVVVTSISGSGGATCNSGVPGDAARPASCRFGTLASGESRDMTIVATVKSGTKGLLENDARVSSDNADSNNSNNLATTFTTVNTSADLALTFTSESPQAKPSSTIHYKVTVDNLGPSDADGVVVRVTLPPAKSGYYVMDNGGCTLSNVTLTCPLGTVAAGSPTREILVDWFMQGAKFPVIASATVGSTTPDPNPANNTASTTVTKL